jgi:hypothetical protein
VARGLAPVAPGPVRVRVNLDEESHRPRGQGGPGKGGTSERLPAARLGSAMIGRSQLCWSTGIAPTSRVNRVEVSKVRMPRSQE